MDDDLLKALRKINPLAEEEVRTFVKSVLNASLKQPARLVEILHSDNNDDSGKAALVIIDLGELCTTPLFEKLNLSNPDSYAWDVEAIVNSHIGNQKKILSVMNNMLKDKRYLKDNESPVSVEETAPSRRTCDAAYIMMRRLFAYEEDEETVLSNINAFLEMSDNQRDNEINRLLETRKWHSLLEENFQQE